MRAGDYSYFFPVPTEICNVSFLTCFTSLKHLSPSHSNSSNHLISAFQDVQLCFKKVFEEAQKLKYKQVREMKKKKQIIINKLYPFLPKFGTWTL